MEEKRFSVFVGGVEVNDFLLTRADAEDVFQHWRNEGYTDVVIVEYELVTINK